MKTIMNRRSINSRLRPAPPAYAGALALERLVAALSKNTPAG
jgi:hypothetical protein